MASSSHLDHTQQHLPPPHTQVKHTLLSTRTEPGSQYLPSWPLVNGETELDGALLLKFTAGKLVDLPANVCCGVVCVCVCMYVCAGRADIHTHTPCMRMHAYTHTHTTHTTRSSSTSPFWAHRWWPPPSPSCWPRPRPPSPTRRQSQPSPRRRTCVCARRARGWISAMWSARARRKGGPGRRHVWVGRR